MSESPPPPPPLDRERANPANPANPAGGGAPFGNFHQYYQFNSAPDRIARIPAGGLAQFMLRDSTAAHDRENDFFVLDVGCNEGDLIVELVKHLQHDMHALGCSLSLRCLGIDIDPALVQRAVLKFGSESSSCNNSKSTSASVLCEAKGSGSSLRPTFQFLCGNIMVEAVHSRLQSWPSGVESLSSQPRAPRRYDLVCCFSVTMWIHIHHGDEGLKKFLRSLSELADHILLEPQPWKCYKTCKERWRRLKQPLPSAWSSLTWRNDVDAQIIAFLVKECKFNHVHSFGQTNWQRQIVFLNRSTT